MSDSLKKLPTLLLTLLLAACAQVTVAPQAPIAPPTLTPLPPTVTSIPTSTSTPETQQPPACTFPLAGTTEESTPETYTFSEPRVVLTAPKGGYYDIVGWLPDNQQVLMTKVVVAESSVTSKIPQEYIELYNPETGKSVLYAIRPVTYEPPSWLPQLNAVIYPVTNFLGTDKTTQKANLARQIWISHETPDTAQLLADNLSQIQIAVKSGDGESAYLADAKLFKQNGLLKKLPSVFFDPSQWDYAKERRGEFPVSYEMVWQPNTSLVFLHSMGGGTLGGGYTFMLDTDTGRVCELKMGGWAYRARWSSNGRYLAIDRSTVYVGFTNVTDLVVLDTQTGNLRTFDVVPQDVTSHTIGDFVWAPDNLHLLVFEDIPSSYDTNNRETIHHELYLVDFMSGQSVHLFPEFKSFFGDGPPMSNFAWSPDRSKLLIRCPTNIVDRICFVSVQRTEQ